MMWHECYTCNISIREKKKMEDAGDRLSAAYDELAALQADWKSGGPSKELLAL